MPAAGHAVQMDATAGAEDFEDASTHVASLAARGELPDSALLDLYALYKLATEGACPSSGRPGVFNPRARRKWDAWRAATERGVEPGEPAAAEYVVLLTKLQPGWEKAARAAGGSGRAGGGGAGGAVISRMAKPEGCSENDDAFILLHAAAVEGDVGKLETLLLSGAEQVDTCDGEGATALHLAADRGQVAAIDLLLRHGAALDALDGEGMSPLHYACLSERRAAAERLVAAGANMALRSNDGSVAADLAPDSWQGTVLQ